MVNFYKAKGIMDSLLTGDIARETLEIAEDEYQGGNIPENEYQKSRYPSVSRDVPPGEDIKWVCGDCMATDWTPNIRRCESCRD